MAFPYFVSETWTLYSLGGALCLALFYFANSHAIAPSTTAVFDTTAPQRGGFLSSDHSGECALSRSGAAQPANALITNHIVALETSAASVKLRYRRADIRTRHLSLARAKISSGIIAAG